MQEFRILTVPYELGRLRDGTGTGAEALLGAGAADALASAGARVGDETIALDEHFGTTGHGDVDAAFALIGAVAGRVGDAAAAGAVPVVLGGSCFLGVGVTAGLPAPHPPVLYLDAHADFNHPDSSEHGYFDGMGLAVMTGGAWQGMFSTLAGAEPIPESSVVLAGARDFDPSEEERLRRSGISHLPPAELRSPDRLIRTLDAIAPPETGVYVHLDLDVIDPSVAPANVYAAPGGLDGEGLVGLVSAVAATRPVRAAALTCYDTGFDPDRRIPPIANEVLEAVARSL